MDGGGHDPVRERKLFRNRPPRNRRKKGPSVFIVRRFGLPKKRPPFRDPMLGSMNIVLNYDRALESVVHTAGHSDLRPHPHPRLAA
jgi:hypothetical protein